MTTSSTPTLDEFRSELRAWLPANLDRRGAAAPDPHNSDHVKEHRAIQRRLHEGGYAGITWPEQYTGRGLSTEYQQAFEEEAAEYVTPDFGVLSMTTFGSCVPTMLRHATPEFLQRHVPRVLDGDELWCQFFSEPAAGSDLAGIQTRATRTDNRWVLSGAKVWSSIAHLADYGMCLARSNWDVPKHRGLTWFAVPTTAANVTVRQIKQITGNSLFCEVFLDDAVVDDAERISKVDDGWTVTNTLLVFERGAGKPGAVEHCERPDDFDPDLLALAAAVGRLDDPQALAHLVSVHVENYASAQLQARIATLSRLGQVTPGIASYGKLGRSGLAAARGRAAVAIGGPGAVLWSGDAPSAQEAGAQVFLGSKSISISGGTEQMQRNGVAERVLGLPREPSYDNDKPFREVLANARNWLK